MMKNAKSTEGSWIDPDDAPKLTARWAEEADAFRAGKLVRRGRPKLEQTKQHVSLRLDPDVIATFKADGPGWQARINDALRKAVGI